MEIKKTLRTIVALAFLGSSVAGCVWTNKMLYKIEGKEGSMKFEEVNSPSEFYSSDPDYRITMTLKDKDKDATIIFIDNNRDCRINAEGDDRVIAEGPALKYYGIYDMEGEWDGTTKDGLNQLKEADLLYTTILNDIKDKLPEDVQKKVPKRPR